MAMDLNVCAHETILSVTPEVELLALKNLGFNGVRIGVVWKYVEAIHGKFTEYAPASDSLPRGFEAFDRAIIAAVDQGLKVNVLLNTPCPSFVSFGWDGSGVGRATVAWANFCKQAALRYKDLGIKQFEIGNEWNIGMAWDNGIRGGYVAKEVAGFIKAGSIAIKEVIPDAVIVSCGLAACLDWPGSWWSRGPSQRLPSKVVADFAKYGVLPHVDKIGYHPYTMADNFTDIQAPSVNHKFIQEIKAIHKVLVDNGFPNMKTELTEYGWSTADRTEAVIADFVKTEWDILHTPEFASLVDGHFVYCGQDFIFPGQTYSQSNREMNYGILKRDGSAKAVGSWVGTV